MHESIKWSILFSNEGVSLYLSQIQNLYNDLWKVSYKQ